MEKISIITICYNSKRFIESTIKSVIYQDYPNMEFIIVDGGSNDGTVDIIKQYESNITQWVSESDRGIYDAMNKGILMATGDWIIFMNSSDCFHSTDVLTKIFIQKQHNEGIKVIYGNVINNYGEKCKIMRPLTINTISYRMPFCHQAAFVRRDILLQIPFDLSYKYSADFNQFYNIYYTLGAKVFKHIPLTVALCDATDCFSRKNMFPMWLEYMKIRAAHKDARWYWDSFKNWIKTTFCGYE